MDTACRHCGEPIDIYEFHDSYDLATDRKLTFKEASTRFAKYGCGWEENKNCTFGMVDPHAALKAEVLQTLSDYPDEWLIDSLP